jgi:hypothetical protein
MSEIKSLLKDPTQLKQKLTPEQLAIKEKLIEQLKFGIEAGVLTQKDIEELYIHAI